MASDVRLSLRTMARLPASVSRPGFDPARLICGIVHLGCGAFHRAHQAVYTQAVLDREMGRWGIIGVSLRSPDIRDRLEPQDGLYTLAQRGPDGDRLSVIGTVRKILVAPEDPGAVLARIAAPDTAIVSLTVTEKGYTHDPATGRLDDKHPDIIHDLANAERPKSTLGVLVRGLAQRRKQGAGPITVLCCDNLPHNGRTLAGLVATFAGLCDSKLARWIADMVTFPSTMVDRIAPATTPADADAVERALGLYDAAPVVAEPFTQWVIEDRFASSRPRWEIAGAELVSDVAPYEAMKLRLLNGSHSALAYAGYLAGHEYVYQVMAQPSFARFVAALMDETTATLAVPKGVDFGAYRQALLARFANSGLKHRTWQIAMDGSQKLPQRLLGTIRENLKAGRPVRLAALAVASWMRYVTGVDEKGRPIDVKDPLAEQLRAIGAETSGNPTAQARAYLSVGAVFGEDLPRAAPFADAVTAALTTLYAKGAVAAVDEAIRS